MLRSLIYINCLVSVVINPSVPIEYQLSWILREILESAHGWQHFLTVEQIEATANDVVQISQGEILEKRLQCLRLQRAPCNDNKTRIQGAPQLPLRSPFSLNVFNNGLLSLIRNHYRLNPEDYLMDCLLCSLPAFIGYRHWM
ncbi:hypothetical protein MRB53_008691 [Persea americana]|uniref:Uncharacterized protein n=1 Tax=Persea americana TaxID=3435 RepID=A0ACC2MMU8_PERAE|nr:hypothetical protein MRB53_008691 [Persea americana]